MKILITGANGMVGQNFYRYLNNSNNDIYLTSRRNINLNLAKNYIQNDFLSFKSFNDIKKFVNPDLILHCAAMTNVDDCEIYKQKAYKINVESTKLLMDLFHDKKIIYISTDAVFGEKNKNKVNEKPHPDNYYGLTKYSSEKIILNNKTNTVIRTTPIGFNYYDNSGFLNWALTSITLKKKINLFSDIYFNPIHSSLLILYIMKIVENNLSGIFHINSNFKYSKYEFVYKLANYLQIDNSCINKISSNDVSLKAKRNKNQVLMIDNSEKKLNVILPNLEDNFKTISQELFDNKFLYKLFKN